MVDALLEEYDFMQMTKDDVIGLLGENYTRHNSESQSWSVEHSAFFEIYIIEYHTGGGLLSDELLSFTFDENGDFLRYYFTN